MSGITTVDKRTASSGVATQDEIRLTDASVVRIDVPRAQIRSVKRSGDDLVIITRSGEVITVHDFFKSFDGAGNDLVLQDDQARGGLWLVDLPAGQGELTAGYSSIDSIEPLMMRDNSVVAAWIWAVGTGFLLSGDDGGGFSSARPPAPPTDSTPPAAPVLDVKVNANGTLMVSGTAEPGCTVHIGFPDGSSVTVVAGSDGSFSVVSQGSQPTGNVVGYATDPAGNTGSDAVVTVVVQSPDQTPPAAPTNVVVSPDGGTVSGEAEPGSTVIVRDDAGNVIASGTAGPNGHFEISLVPPQNDGGDITAVAQDAAGNTGAGTVMPTPDTTAPDAPTASVNERGDGTIAVSGTTEPGATVHVTFPDGSTGNVVADPSGHYTIDSPAGVAQPDGNVVVHATDASGNGPGAGTTTVYQDTIAPGASTIGTVTDDTGSIIGPLTSGSSTDDRTPTFAGSGANPGDTITLYDGTTVIGSAVVDAGGNWSVTPGSPLGEGSHSLTSTATDPSGNESTPSAGFTLTVSTIAPGVLTVGSVSDNVGTVQGALVSGASTDDATPTVTGSGANPGDIIKLYDGVALIGSAAVAADGTWSITLGSSLSDGAHSLISTATSNVGIEGSGSTPFSLTVDTTAPAIPSLNTVTDDQGNVHGPVSYGAPTDDTQPAFSGGGATPGDTITLYDGAIAIGSALVQPDGTWSVVPTALLAEGPHSLTLTATDPTGNASAPSAGFTLTVDTTAPSAPAVTTVIDNVGLVQGALTSGDSTDDATPTFIGSGATSGDTVTLYEGVIVIGTALVAPNGTWSIEPNSPLIVGSHSLTLTNTDPAGNQSAPSAPFDLTVVSPAATSAVPNLGSVADDQGSVTGSISQGGSTNDTQPTFSGSGGTPGDTVTLYEGATVIGTTVVQPDGTWTVTPTGPLSEGAHTVTLTETYFVTSIEGAPSAPFDFTVDTAAPGAPTLGGVIDNAGAAQGQLTSGGSTDDTKPTFTGSGANPGDTVNLYDGATLIGSALVAADGTWSVEPNSALADGTHNLALTATDPAGNQSPATPFDLTINSNPPPAPTVDGVNDNVGAVQGALANGATTDDAAPTVTGSGANPNDTIKLYDGATLIGSALVAADGTWSVTPVTPLADGIHSLTAVATNGVGTAGPASAPFSLTVDTTAPTAPSLNTVTDDRGSIQGAVSYGSATDDTQSVLSGNGATPGDTIKLYDGATVIGSAGVQPDGTWSVSPTAPLAEGTHSLTLTATDPTGNESLPTASFDLMVDTTASSVPTIGSATDTVGSITGALTSGSSTDDTTPTISGNGATPGDLIKLYDGATLIGSVVVDAGGNWSIAPSTSLSNGSHSLTSTATDPAGNESTPSAGFTLIVDTSAPTQTTTVVSYTDNVGTNQANYAGGTSTDDTTPALNGTLSAAIGATDVVRIYEGATLVGTATVTGTSWTFATPALVSGTSHTYTAVVTDAAGNEGTPSSGFTLTVDTTAPTETATVVSYTDNVGTNQADYAGGTSTDDTTPVLNGILSAAIGATDVVRIYEGATLLGTATVVGTAWTFATSTLVDGTSHTYTAVVADATGNEGAASVGFTLTVDTSAPTQTTSITSYVDNVGTNQGSYTSGTSTDDTTPVLNGTLSAAIGATDVVRIYEGATLLGTANVVGTTWTFAAPTLIDGSSHAYAAVVADAAGNEGAASVGFTLTVDTTAPTQTTSITSYADNVGTNQGAYSSGTSTDDTTPVLSGTLSAAIGATDVVRIYEGATLLGAATVVGTTWTFAAPTLVDGSSHTYMAVVADAAGNEGVASVGFTLTVDTTAPAQTTSITIYTDDVGTNQGAYSSGTSTDDTTPILTGTLSAAIGATDVVRVYEGATLLGAATVIGTTWTFATPTLADGSSHTYTAVISDAAGNESTPSAGFTLTVDTAAPTQTTTIASYTDDVGTNQSTYASGTSTDDTTPVLNGTLSAAIGATDVVRIYEGATLLGTATVVGTTWTFATPTLIGGSSHTYTAVVADAAGNEGTASVGFTLTVDTTAPTRTAIITSYADNVGTDQGSYTGGTSTDDTTPVLNGSLNAAIGATDVVRIYDGATLLGAATVVGTNWTFATPTLVNGSSHTYRAVVADAAGNEGTPSAGFTLTVDTTAPTQTTTIVSYVDNVGTNVGEYPGGISTDSTTPVLEGTLSAVIGATDVVRVYEGATLLGTATVYGTLWLFSTPSLADGSNHTYTAVVTDAAGNEGTVSNTFTLTVDTTAPTQTTTITSYTDDVGTDQGTYASGVSTDDTTPVLNGTLNAAIGATDVVRIYEGGTLLGTATVIGTTWTFATPALTAGSSHTYAAVVADAAGNEGTPSAPFTLTVDTTAPTQTVSITSYWDEVGVDQGSYASGTSTDDTEVVLTGTLSAAIDATDVIRIYEGATLLGTALVIGTIWVFELPTLIDGSSHTYTAVVADAVGNEGTASAAFTLTVDTTAPTQTTTLTSYTDDVGINQSTYASGTSTDDTTPVLNGTLSGAIGATDLVRVYEGATLLGTATVVGTTWTFATPTLANGSTHTYTAVVADAAGNEGTLSSGFTLTVNTTAPSAPTVGSVNDNAGTVQGALVSGATTDDATPTATGSGANPGDIIKLYDGVALIGSAAVAVDGTWSITPVTLLADGAHSLVVTATNTVGTESLGSTPFNLTVDTTAPTTPSLNVVTDDQGSVQSPVSFGGATDDTRPAFSGNGATPGDTITLYDGGATVIGSAVVQPDGSWSVAPTAPLADGPHSLTLTATDPTGNRSAPSVPFALTVDTSAPSAPAVTTVIDNVGLVQGVLTSGDSTDDATPTFIGSGATSGDTITLYEGAAILGTALVAPNGTWSIEPGSPLSIGSHTLTLTNTDPAGNQSATSTPFDLTVVSPTATSAVPNLGSVIDDQGSVTGSISEGGSTNDTQPTFSGGSGTPGDTVTLYEGAAVIGTAVVQPDGTWTITPAVPLSEGAHTVRLTETYFVTAIESDPSAPFDFTVDTTAPGAPTIGSVIDNAGAVQGQLISGSSTDDTTPTFTGSGANPGDTIKLYDGVTFIGSTLVAADGSWSIEPGLGLINGTHNLALTATDPAGNEGAATLFDLTVNSSAPAAPTVDSVNDNVGTVQGSLVSGATTDDATPTVTGSGANPGDIIKLYDGVALIGSTTVAGDGTWSITPSTPLADGAHSLSSTTTNSVGIEGAGSTPFTISVDTTAPTTPSLSAVADDQGSIHGTVSSGGTTDDTQPAFSGNGATPGDTVKLYDGAAVIGSAVVQPDGTWSVTPTVPLIEGTHGLTLTATDPIGNESAPTTSFVLMVDTTAPNAPTIGSVTDDAGSITGSVTSGSSTDDGTPTVSGNGATPGDLIKLYDGATLIGSAVVAAGGAWSITPSTPLTDGSHNLTTTATDPAGNGSTPSTGFTLVVDTSAPTQTTAITGYADNVGTNQGSYAGGTSTDDTTPVLNGTLNAAIGATDVVRIYEGAVLLGTATVAGTTWTFATPTLLNSSSHTYTAVVADAAGNESTPSAGFALTVDATAPTQTVSITNYWDGVGIAQGYYASGTSTDDTAPELGGTLNVAIGATDVIRIYEGATLLGTATTIIGTTWVFELPTLIGGSHTYTAVVADAAGNEGAASAGFTLTVDTTAPTQTTSITTYTDDVGTNQSTYASGTSTDDTTPVLNGTLSGAIGATDVVRVYEGATLLGTATVVGTTWTFATPTLTDGSSHTYTAVVADAAGNEGAASVGFTLTVDRTAPTQTTSIVTYTDNVGTSQSTYASGTSTDDTTPVLNGTLSGALGATDVVRIYEGATLLGTAIVAGTNWTFAIPTLINGSSHTYRAVVTDAAGNEGTSSAGFTLTVDTIAPTQTATIASYTDNVGTTQGSYAGGTSTDDTTPVLNGTLSATIGATDVVRIYEGATLLGTATVVGTNWTFATPALVNGSSHTYTAVVTDAAGNEGTVSGGFALTVNTTAPTQTITITGYADNVGVNQGIYASGTSTDDTTPVLNGTLSATLGATDVVRIYEGVTLLGTATVIGTTWTFATPTLAAGSSHTYTAVVADAAGNEGTVSGAFALTVDTTAPSASETIAIGSVTTDTGASATDFNTSNNTLVFNGTLGVSLAPGDGVQISLDGGATWHGASVAGTSWSYNNTGSPLADGTYNVQARVIDAAGNVGQTASQNVVVDTTAPSASETITIASITTDTGTSSVDFNTSDRTLMFNGTLGAVLVSGEGVQISLDGGATWLSASVAGTAWSYDNTGTSLADGTYDVRARVIDVAGNVGQTASQSLVIDNAAPSATAAISAITTDSGLSASDYTTSDQTLVVNATLTGVLAGGEKVQISLNGGSTWQDATLVSGSTYSLNNTGNTLAAGDYTFAARVVNAAGNASAAGLQAVVIDTTGPAITSIGLTAIATDTTSALAAGTGSTTNSATNTDLITRDTLLTVSGTYAGTLAASGEFLQISSDGGATWNNVTSFSNATHTWSYTDSVQHTTAVTYLLRAVDTSGNLATGAGSQVVTVDAVAPVQGLLAPVLTSAYDSGVLGDHITTNTSITFSSSNSRNGEAGASLVLVNDVNKDGVYSEGIDSIVGTTTVAANGTWSIAAAGLTAGSYRLGFMQVDAAGNRSRLSGITEVDVIGANDHAAAVTTGWGGTGTAGSAENKGTAYTVGNNGLWQFYSNLSIYNNTGASSTSYTATALTAADSSVNNVTFVDYNRDGLLDILGEDNSYGDGQQSWTFNGSAYASFQVAGTSGSANAYLLHGTLVAYDKTGDGNTDLVYGESYYEGDANAPGGLDSQFMINTGAGTTAGAYTKDGNFVQSPTGALVSSATAQPFREISGVDINNDGAVDIVFHQYNPATSLTGLSVLSNSGSGSLAVTSTINGVFASPVDNSQGISMTWADFNGDGYLDLFLGSGYQGSDGSAGTANESRIYFNNTAGGLSSAPTWFGDTLNGGASLAVDWNHDGRVDLIELPNIGAVASPINLYTNGGNGSSWSTSTLATGVTANSVTGAVAADYDWDGAVDLIYFSTGSTQAKFIQNTNVVQAGSSMHLRIVDANGITSYFGNTVQLFNSAGTLVASQIISPQSGSNTNDSSAIVNFYGLSASDTYTAVLLRNVGGASSDVGGLASAGSNTVETVNASWTGLIAGAATNSYMLSAESGSNAANGNFVGTGYNDTFYATAGGDTYNGSGGWSNARYGTPTWSSAGGEDVVDFKLAGTTGVTVNLNTAGAQATGFNTATFLGIEGLRGGSGNDVFTASTSAGANNVFEGRGGNDTFNVTAGGHTALTYNLLNGSDSTGGNGSDTITGFTVGSLASTAAADVLDLTGLLSSYTGSAHVYLDATTGKYALDYASQGLASYLQVSNDGVNTTISVDLTGSSSFAGAAHTLATLSGVVTDLPALLANNQLLVASSGGSLAKVVINPETTTDTTPVVSGTIPHALSNGAHMEVTINGVLYSSANGAVVLDPANNAWYVQVPGGNALSVGTYDVTAVVIDSVGTVLTQDSSSGELVVTGAPAAFSASGLPIPTTPTYTSGMSAGFDASGNLLLSVREGVLTQTSLTGGSVVNNGLTQAGDIISNTTVADYNRDGYSDIAAGAYYYGANTQPVWTGSASGAYAGGNIPTGANASLGGVVTYDKEGDGYLDFIWGDWGDDSFSVAKNTAGVLSADTTSYSSIATKYNDREVSGVDVNNDGDIDIAMHTAAITGQGNNVALSILANNGSGAFSVAQAIPNIFNNNNDNAYDAVSMTWADFNGDGYLDLYLNRANNTGLSGNISGMALSNAGVLPNALSFQLSTADAGGLAGGASVTLDWNLDGHMDVIELANSSIANGAINLYTNNGAGTSYTGSVLGAAGAGQYITGASAVDVNWDGSVDLVYSTRAGAVATIANANAVPDGTSLHVRILDQNGINSYYGNTVQLFNSAGQMVSTQMINAQSGVGANDGTGLVNFYGLNAGETYSVALIRAVSGVSADISDGNHAGTGAAAVLASVENINTTWGGLTAGESTNAYVLSGESSAASNAGTFVGTGYNDTFYGTAGNDNFKGAGGTVTISGTDVWSATGGMDVVDYKLSASAITADLNAGTVTGQGSDTLANIEGIAGTALADTLTDNAADNQFEGRGGNDTFNLTHGGHDTLIYKLLSAANDGGNGSDAVNGFKVGTWEGTPDTPRIDLHSLLVGYTGDGGASYVNGVATIAGSAGDIGSFLQVTQVGADTVISIDRDGAGSTYSSTTLLTLNNVHTDLATLLANHQLVLH
ncbi:MAG: Ig-like domain-containing protein [Gammaproteobacteria bacterium]